MGRRQSGFQWPDFSRHQPLGARPEPHKQAFARFEIRDAETPQRLHMDENIFRPLPARDEAKAPRAIEPFDDHDFEPACRRDLNMCARCGLLSRMHSGRFIHRHDAEHLKALGALLDFTDYARAFGRRVKSIPLENGDMQEHVSATIVRNNESIAFGDIKPFYVSSHLNQIEWRWLHLYLADFAISRI